MKYKKQLCNKTQNSQTTFMTQLDAKDTHEHESTNRQGQTTTAIVPCYWQLCLRKQRKGMGSLSAPRTGKPPTVLGHLLEGAVDQFQNSS